MRITQINNQRTNNKQAFGMSVKRINTAGMTNLEKQAIAECIPKLRKMADVVDFDIELKELRASDSNNRMINILSSTPQKSNIERIAEFFPTGSFYSHSKHSDLEWLKSAVMANASSSKDNYLKHSNELADKALKQSLKPQKEIAEKGAYQPKSGPKNMTPPSAE